MIESVIYKADKAFGQELPFGYSGIEGVGGRCAQEKIGENRESGAEGGAFTENGIGFFDIDRINNNKITSL